LRIGKCNFDSRRKYYRVTVGILLLGNVLGVVLVQGKDNIHALQLSSYNNIKHQDINTPASSKITQLRESFNGHEYLLIQADRRSWNGAKRDCESRGGYLVTIHSQEENDFVRNLVESAGFSSAWIGFTDELTEGGWIWVTGEAVTYTNWEEGEPNGFLIENHGEITSGGTWNDLEGEAYSFPYICEWESETDEQSAPTVLILSLAIIAIIPEFYLGKKLRNFVNRYNLDEGVENSD